MGNELAVLHRLRGELALASKRNAQAVALAKPWPHLTLSFLLQQAVTGLQADEPGRARAVLKELGDLLTLQSAPHVKAAYELVGAIVEWRSGNRPLAEQALERALQAILEGGYYHLAIAQDLFCEPVLMEGFDLERHRCRLRVCRMLELSADRAFERGLYEESRALSERLLEIQPTHEEAHRQLMRIYELFGQKDLLRRQYQLCERLMRQELDLEPSAETRRLGQAIS